jgi:hypothetical protein
MIMQDDGSVLFHENFKIHRQHFAHGDVLNWHGACMHVTDRNHPIYQWNMYTTHVRVRS